MTLAASPSSTTQRVVPGLDPTARASSENFPVAFRLLPRQDREDLLAIYGFARLVDDLGDELPGGAAVRLAALDEVEAELDRALAGSASHPVLARLAPVLVRRRLERQPFADLIEANRRDQEQLSYDTWDDLLGYCRLSADPVGRMVLGLAGRAEDAKAVQLSDQVCTALQVLEHLQDVAEDASRGRVYLPAEERAAFGVSEAELTAPTASPALRRLVAFELARVAALLDAAPVLVRSLSGSWRLAVAGFAGGGRAQVEAIERASYDVLSPPRPVQAGKAAVARHSLRLLLAARTARSEPETAGAR